MSLTGCYNTTSSRTADREARLITVNGWRSMLVAAAGALVAPPAATAQAAPRADTTAADTLRAHRLAPLTVSVARAAEPLTAVPGAVASVTGPELNKARPTWGLDEALATVPGVYAANRYNFALDQRISIRGFGARASFGLRGIKVLLDGIPQTLPDGTGQLTNLELGSADRLEVRRGPSSALFGNAAGGVISIATDRAPPERLVQELRLTAGSFSRRQVPIVGSATGETWTKWVSDTRLRVGGGYAALTASRLVYGGQRQHSAADLRNLNARYVTPLAPGLVLSVIADVGDDPRAENPGALTAAELARNPDSAAAVNLSARAGKSVTQYQGGATLTAQLARGGEASLTLFGIARRLRNPQTFAYISLDRRAFGARATLSRPVVLGPVHQVVTAGVDVQRQHDARANFGNPGGRPDTVRQLDQIETVTEVGPFVQSAVALAARTTLTAGLRYDWLAFEVRDRLVTPTNPDDSGRRLMASPSAFLGLTRSEGRCTLYANAGTSFETPTTTELGNRPDTAGGFNAALGPQRATNLEIGVRAEVPGRGGLSLAVYQDDVRGELIAYQVPASPGRVFYRNAGRSRHRGVEAGARLAIAGGLELAAAWTLSDFRYADYTVGGTNLGGRRIPGIPVSWLHLLWRLRPPSAGGAWTEIEQAFSSGFLVSDTLATRTAPWWRMDVRVGWDGTLGGLRVGPFAGLNNVLDHRYVGSVVANASGGRYYEPAPGRNLYLGLTLAAGR
jgi:iron complex outermembrane receptor protein